MSIRNTILIIDFGSCHVSRICGLINELNNDLSVKLVNWKDFDSYDFMDSKLSHIIGIILSGSPSHLYEKDAPNISNKIFTTKVPVLGICYGMQVLAQLKGCIVEKMENPEYDDYKVKLVDNHESMLFKGLPNIINVAMRHNDQVINIPEYFKITSHTDNCIASIEHIDESNKTYIYAVQYHPELKRKGSGGVIFENFLSICFTNKNHKASNITYCIIN